LGGEASDGGGLAGVAPKNRWLEDSTFQMLVITGLLPGNTRLPLRVLCVLVVRLQRPRKLLAMSTALRGFTGENGTILNLE
jgi:hypothetical protein